MPSLDEQDGITAFGNNVRRIRKEKGLTMEELANIAEIEVSQIYRIENAIRNVRLSTVFTVARALGVPPEKLFAEIK